ncbi:Tetraspanin family-domain-containing protein [Lobosporangium transversale]|uniref:Tetraspanin family-domain-containing protein n=1 Tax=Lobosporangium transversale TaxID=64571 RepID=A0A1Y2H5H8_9FUNG|nr:Tetraspanin family-domain-containing protein [Lobosporangium transversale]ORZ28963.1 Tetraspanin family-domain-containing protein [Lobosporangium transversale]|eukprot:XP_021886636.1 Tetraspanin family-domain-containing protein [Lobosporangium transversale]
MNHTRLYQYPARLFILGLNVVAMVSSVGLTAVGIFGLSDSTRVLIESEALSWILIILSLIILLISMLGCAAALSGSKRTLAIYGVLVSFLVLLQLGLIIFALTQHDRVDLILDKAWERAYDRDPLLLQDLETRFHCCGFASVDDRAVPKDPSVTCRVSPAFGYTVPCKERLRESYLRHEASLLSVTGGTQFLQILALAATVVLWLQLPRDNEVEQLYRTEHSQRLLQGLRQEDQEQRQYRESSAVQGEDRIIGSQYGSAG